MEQKQTTLAIALAYQQAGYSVIPVRCDGSKASAVRWKEHTQVRAPESAVQCWFCGDRDHGIAIVCGEVSGNLECLDFDQAGFYPIWCQLVEQEGLEGLLSELPVHKTPNGYHVFWASPHAEGSKKLAVTADGQVAIETRGEGAYCIAPGSPPPVHTTSAPYLVDRHGLYFAAADGTVTRYLPAVDTIERETLLKCARALTECEEKPKTVVVGQERADKTKSGGDYNARADWTELLAAHDWRPCEYILGTREDSTGVSYWTRPGKERGVSASLGKCRSEDGEPKLYVFSTSAAPLEAGCSYSKFALYAAYEHNGDYSAAAKALAAEGYGEVRHSHETFKAINERCADLWKLEQLKTRPEEPAGLKLLRSNNGKFRGVFNATDLDRDKQVGSILAHCARAGLSVRDTCDVLYLCPGLGRRAFDDLEALARRVAWHLYESNLSETADSAVAAEVESQFETGDEDKRKDLIRNRLGFGEFERLIQSGKDHPYWSILLVDGTEVAIGKTARLLNQAGGHVREVLLPFGILLARAKQREWDQTVRMMQVHTGLYRDNEMDWWHLVPQWVAEVCEHEARDEEDRRIAIQNGHSFVEGETFWVLRDAICQIAQRFDPQITQPAICVQLRRYGFAPKQVKVAGKNYRYWIGKPSRDLVSLES